MKVIVTGGAGFIGSHITELLCNKSYTVIVLDNLSFGHKKFVDSRARFIKGDVGDFSLMCKVLKGADAVIHLAASSIIKFSYESPVEYFQNNLINGVMLLEAMRKAGVKKIIYSSTAAVYGIPKKIPIPEEAPKLPINAYGASKLAFEEALAAYYSAFGIESVSLRYFNAYGPRDEQIPASRAVPMWIKAIIKDVPVERYWKGQQIRDYVYVRDIADAHIAVLQLRGLHYYNIGSGIGIGMRQVLDQIEKNASKKLKILEMGERAGDPQKLVADISKIMKEVGWKPKTSFAKGLRETYRYYKNQ